MSNSQTTQVTDSPNPYNSPLIRDILDLEDDIIDSYKPKKKLVCVKYNKTIYFNQNASPKTKQKTEEKVEKYLEKVMPQTNNNKNNTNNKPINFKVNINNNYYSTFEIHNTNNNSNANNKMRTKANQPIGLDDINEVNPLFIGVPCINCGNSIPIDCIESHSVKCTRVSEEMMLNEKSNIGFYSINYKLKKLKEHLVKIHLDNILIPLSIQNEMKAATQILINFIHSVENMETIVLATIKEFKMIMKGLDELSDKYKKILSIMILIDRTKVLVNEKMKIFKEQYRILKNTKEINNQKTGSLALTADSNTKQNLTMQSKQPQQQQLQLDNGNANGNELDIDKEIEEELLKTNKKKDQTGLKYSPNMLEEIVSEIEKRSCVLSDHTSLSSIAFGKEEEAFINDNEINIDFASINTEEAKEKKAFFKTVLRLKFEKLHSTHLGQKISQKALYSEVKKYNIPRDKWSDFIISELKNPNKYIMNKSVRYSEKMDVIEEEK